MYPSALDKLLLILISLLGAPISSLPDEIAEYFPALSDLNIYPSDTYVYNYSGDIIKGEEGESYFLEIIRRYL